MAIYTSNTFIGQRIKLDDNTFEGNKFTNCILVYGGGPLTFNNNSLNSVQWEFVDDAARTLGLLSSFYQGGGQSQQFIEMLLSTFGKQASAPQKSVENDNE
ncbi:hypothetical protein H5185_08790 [Shewanella sp. SG44-6]|uniref:hypothetical protein n=1 Tax=Shewanella sp. SG44-6 TaxID=2760959 RepID=UPI00160117A7|nr:hypothetical protein [Shewanella sp. SG44-6]MBB1389518.1 hypothetical protein [Shewanella sp. SG44-6]